MARSKKSATVFEKGSEQAVIVGETIATVAQDATVGEATQEATTAPEAATLPPEPPTVAPEAPVAEPKKRGRPAKASSAPVGDLTMAQLAEGYIESLRVAGKGLGTQFSYSIDMSVAVKHFGEDTLVSSLTARKVQNFFDSDAVTKTRSGRGKARPGIDKTRRVLRLALCWAFETKLISELPVPESAMPRAKKDAEVA